MARNSDGRLEVFEVASNGYIYHQWQVTRAGLDSWSGWAALPGVLHDLDPALVATADLDGRLEVFAVDGGNLLHTWQDPDSPGGWGGFVPLPGITVYVTPAVAKNQAGPLEIFDGSVLDSHIWHSWQVPGGWSNWSILDT